jgi:UDP-glucose:(heptosyl)LPS alpha-1,3-glucosyltransferase
MALEAMAAGLLVIVSNRIGLSEYIESGVNGFIYDGSNLSDLEKILYDLNSGLFNTDMIKTNAQRLCSELKWDNVSSKYIDLYKKLLFQK